MSFLFVTPSWFSSFSQLVCVWLPTGTAAASYWACHHSNICQKGKGLPREARRLLLETSGVASIWAALILARMYQHYGWLSHDLCIVFTLQLHLLNHLYHWLPISDVILLPFLISVHWRSKSKSLQEIRPTLKLETHALKMAGFDGDIDRAIRQDIAILMTGLISPCANVQPELFVNWKCWKYYITLFHST